MVSEHLAFVTLILMAVLGSTSSQDLVEEAVSYPINLIALKKIALFG